MIGPRAIVAESADNDVAIRQTQSEVQAALATLSKAEREVLGLAYWGGLTQSEIATVLRIPTGTVKSRPFSALARLREALVSDGVSASSRRSAGASVGETQIRDEPTTTSAEEGYAARTERFRK